MKKRQGALILLILLLISLLSVPALAERQFEDADNYSGLGIIAIQASGGFQVSGIFKGSPASGRLDTGDVILEVNGSPTRNMTRKDFYTSIRKSTGTEIKLKALRNNSPLEMLISCGPVKITPDTLPASASPMGKVTGFQTGTRLNSSLGQVGKLTTGDVFFLFRGDRHIGFARIKELYGDRSCLSTIYLTEALSPRNIREYRLYYYGHVLSSDPVPGQKIARAQPSPSPSPSPQKGLFSGTGPVNGDEKPDVKVDSCELFISSSKRLQAKVKLVNHGKAIAFNTILTCTFVGGDKYDCGQSTVKIKKILPGDRTIEIFTSNLTWKSSSNLWRLSDDRKTLYIHRGSDRYSRLIYKVECRFKFE